MKDDAKVVAAIETILQTQLVTQQQFVFVHGNSFYDSCGVSYMRKRHFHEEVSEYLSCSSLCRKYGEWMYTEYGDGMYVFVRLTRPGESSPRSTIKLLVERGAALEHKFNA